MKRIKTTPIVIITDENAISIANINFPSVTFCETVLMNFGEDFDFHEIGEKFWNGNLSLETLSETA